jgi:hypothetical protein
MRKFNKRCSYELADNLLDDGAVLEWLRKNRFKHMELDLFMYSILAIAATFVFYTFFLLFGFKPKEAVKKVDEEEDVK